MKGVVSPGKYIAAVIPAMEEFLLFKVKSVVRAGDGVIRYGSIPGATTIGANTIYPDVSKTWTLSANNVQGLQNLGGNKSDYIFYVSKDKPDRIFEYEMHVTPEVLQHVVYYPEIQVQSSFQNTSFSPIDDMGTFGSPIRVLQLPNCKSAFQTYNPLNVGVRTNVVLDYVQYVVRPISSMEEAREAVSSGAVIPKVLPVYVSSDFFEREVVNSVYNGATFPNDLLQSVFFREEYEPDSMILNLFGKTDGTNTTGNFSLESDVFDGETEALVIPKGYKLKIWNIEVDGEPCTVAINVLTGNPSSPTVSTIKTVTLASPGTVSKEYVARPLVIDCANVYAADNVVALQLAWTQVTAGESTVSLEAELVKGW